jgi:hypothetical protein
LRLRSPDEWVSEGSDCQRENCKAYACTHVPSSGTITKHSLAARAFLPVEDLFLQLSKIERRWIGNWRILAEKEDPNNG